jgi:lambda family phage tail tape measure protein
MANLDALLRIRSDVQGANSIVALNRGLQGVERTAAGATVALRGLQASVGGVIGLVGGATVMSKIFGDTATLQTQTRSLEVLLGSAAKASQIVKELQAYGAVTPFESTELIETAKRLGAFGIAGQRVVEVTKRLGDVAGATGSNLGELATAYGQVVSKGRLQTEELLQFQERGVGIQAELQKMYGLSGQELQKALSDGRVSSEAFEQAIVRLTDKGGKYADGAIAQSDTLNGRLSTLRDTVTSLLQTIGTVMEPALNRVLLLATNTVDTINRATRAALMGPQNADTIAQVNAGQLPFGTAGEDKLIGEQRRKALQGQAAGQMGLINNDKYIKLLQQQPEFRSPAGTGGRTAPLAVPPLTSGTRAAGGGGGGGGRATGGRSAGGKSQSPAAQIANALKSALGLTDAQAAGIVGNLMRESGLNPRVNEGGAVGLPRGVGGYGLAQWTGTRQTDLVRFAGGRGQAGDMATQLRFMVSELMGPEAASLAKLKTAQSPEQAAYLFDKHYERSGVKAMGERQANARKVFGEISGGGPGAGLADYGRQLQDQTKEAAEAAEQTQKQLTAARNLLSTSEARLQVAAAMDPLEKAQAEYDQARSDRMREYAEKYAGVRSAQEGELLMASQINDWALQKLELDKKMAEIADQRLITERQQAEALKESMAYMQEMSSRTSVGAGLQQGLQGYVDSIGNMRDAVSQLTTEGLGGLGDVLTELAITGPGNYRAFAASILKDTGKMIFQQMVLKTIMSLIGGIGGGVGRNFEMPDRAFIPSAGYSFAGGGYTGNGPRSGGLDGQGGFLAVMHPRETVIDHTKSAPMTTASGSTNITINVDATGTKAAGDQGRGRALADDLAQVVDARLIYQRRPGGLLNS